MKNILARLAKATSVLVSTSAAGFYMIVFAAAIGAATFIENDFGTSAAQKVVFKAWWFELLLLLFAITLIVNVVKFRMVQQKSGPWSSSTWPWLLLLPVPALRAITAARA